MCCMLFTLTACAATTPFDPGQPYPPAEKPQVGDILHMATGVYISPEQMYKAVSDTRMIYVGETHDNPASHRLQLNILRYLDDRYPGNVALGMEMFTPSQQPILDQWSAGQLSEKELLSQSRWYQQWGMDFDYYRDLLIYARNHQIPVIGLNVEASLKQAVKDKKFDQLPPEMQKQLPEMDLDDPYQTRVAKAYFKAHAHGNSQVGSFLRVQTLWDESMAENAANFMQQAGNQQRMLIVAGGNHIRYGYGIPRRVFRRIPLSYSLVGSEELDIPEDKQDRLMHVDMPDLPMPAYHYLQFVHYEDLPQRGVKLGVMMSPGDAGIVVKGVMPDSAAQKAGIQTGDILKKINKAELKEYFDLIYELKKLKQGSTISMLIQRQSEELTLLVSF